ncbi:MAG: hypothetical protein H7319_22885 [Spirosoma sp.]|nr:hypothetical protein [Spirosoma sp.]
MKTVLLKKIAFSLLFGINLLMPNASFSQISYIAKPGEIIQHQEFDTWPLQDDRIYVKLISVIDNKKSDIYTFKSTNGRKNFTEAALEGQGSTSQYWQYKVGDKIQIWEKDYISDDRVFTYTFKQSDFTGGTTKTYGNSYYSIKFVRIAL